MAGVVLTTLLVPQGMAYAELAGLPAITGLYTSILCLIGYAVFGPSRILVLGPDSSLGPMIAATILPLVAADGDPARAVALASMLALIVGAIMILAGVAKLGFVADLLSKPTMIGYMNGLALTILVGQLPKLFGFSRRRRRPDRGDHGVRERAGERRDGAGRRWRSGSPGSSLILVLQRWLPEGARPSSCMVVLSIVAATAVRPGRPRRRAWSASLPQGFPPFTIPHVVGLRHRSAARRRASASRWCRSTDTISTASSFAARSGQEVHGNQEMIGIGAANLAAGLFQGFPVSTSGSRTAVAERVRREDAADRPGRGRG